MKRIIARLYITIITVMILFGLILLINEIRVSRNEYINESVKVSEETKSLIENNWFKNKNFENQSLSDSLKDFMNYHKNIHSIIIYSKDRGLTKFNTRHNDRAFLLNSLIPNDPSWDLRPEYSFNWWERYKNNVISSQLQIDERGYAFDLIYNVLSPDKIEKVFKDAFIVVLIFLILTVVVIIIFSIWKSKNSIEEYDDEGSFTGVPITETDSVGSLDEIGEPQSLSDLDMDFEDDLNDSEDDLGNGFEDSKSDLDDLDNFDMDLGDDSDSGELDDLDDFDMDFADDSDTAKLEDLDDFDMDFGDDEDATEPETLDDFDMDFGDDEDATEPETLNDFDLDFGDDEDATEPETLDDFDMDFGDDADATEPETLDDFDMDFGDDADATEPETLDDFDLETGDDSENLSDLDDFDLETGDDSDNLSDLDDFDLETGDDSEDISDLDDFDLETGDDSEDISDLDEFDLETGDDSEDISDLDEFDLETGDDSDNLSDLDDFDLETNDDSEDLSELDDFDLETNDDSEDLSELDDLGDLTESLDDEEETSYNLDDFALDSDNDSDGYDLEDFSLDKSDIEFDDDDYEDGEISVAGSKLKETSEIGPDLSSMLEKASVAETDLSVVIVNIKDNKTKDQYNFINEQFDGKGNVYKLNDDQIVITLNDTNIDNAISNINEVLFNAEKNDLSMSIGVSSMSGRRVGENRLLGEAIKAVQKADELSKDMLAFRPDPEKYKNYIKNS